MWVLIADALPGLPASLERVDRHTTQPESRRGGVWVYKIRVRVHTSRENVLQQYYDTKQYNNI